MSEIPIAPVPVIAPLPVIAPAPREPGWWRRVWPPLTGAADRPAFFGVLTIAVIGCLLLRLDRGGVDWLVIAVTLAVVIRIVRRGSRSSAGPAGRAGRIAWAAASLALVSVSTFRADGWLDTWTLLAALAVGSVAVAGGAAFRGLAAGAVAFLIGFGRGMPWWIRGARRRRPASGVRIGWVAAACAGLLGVFVPLLATADPEFAHVLSLGVPHLDGDELGRAILGLVVAAVAGLGFVYVAASRASFDGVPSEAGRTVRRGEWVAPLAVLDALFLGFVLVQLATLFGGRQRVLRTAGLTYAEYARSGFWQLLIVAGLTLIVIAATVRIAPRATRTDRMLLRVLLGALATLTLVIVASALHRLSVYDNAYGYTRLRLAVGVTEICLGLVFVYVLVAGVRLRARWLPRLAVATAIVALLAVAVLNPDRFIADRNIDRYQRTGAIDLAYLGTLSADAVPAVQRLPPELRGCVLDGIGRSLAGDPDDWRTWNLSRTRALAQLRAAESLTC